MAGHRMLNIMEINYCNLSPFFEVYIERSRNAQHDRSSIR